MRSRGYTMIDVLVVLGVLATLIVLLPLIAGSVSSRSRSYSCKGYHRQLMLACITYRDGQGRAVSFPPADGSEFLIHLYVSEEISEPGLLICASSGDSNGDGARLRSGTGRLPQNTCSFAGRRNRDQTSYPGIFTNKGASETPASSDDSEGDTVFNHGDTVNLGFVDGHVEILDLDDPRLRGTRVVGRALLDPLAD